MQPFDRVLSIFWLLGPLILLIERTPADVWVSLIGICFIFRCFRTDDWAWLKIFWVRAGLFFWVICLLCSTISPIPEIAIVEAFIWFRFPLFAFAVAFWLSKKRRIFYGMLLSTGIGLFLMCLILTAELIVVGNPQTRLSWPYGDHVPGSYLAKVGLPVFVVIISLAVSAPGHIAKPSALFALITIIISVFAGERINFLIRACAGTLAAFVWRPKFKRALLIIVMEISAVLLLFLIQPDVGKRFTSYFWQQLPIFGDSDYLRQFSSGIQVWETSKVFGVGVGNFRYLCAEIVEWPAINCKNHPHNYYIQLLAETGIIGLIFGSVFIASIIYYCWEARRKNKDNVIVAGAFIVPFALFWPVASTADFFGQWNNIFMWSAVSLAVASANLNRSSSS